MFLILIELDGICLFTEVVHRSVDSRTHITGLPVILDKLRELTLLTSNGRSHNDKSGSFGIELKLINYLVDALGSDGLAALPADGLTYSRIQKS